MTIAETRTIYNNYDLWDIYPDEDLKEQAIECGWVDTEDEITDNMLNEWRYEQSEIDWECEKERLSDFFKDKTVGFFGKLGLWDGVYKAGKIGEFWDLYNEAMKDCYYVNIYDENGHMYLNCTHHDGTNHFEIKVITEKGKDYLDRWEYNWNDKRTLQYCHNQIYKRYSHIPRFAEKVYGCKARAYKESTKADLINKLNNCAKSFYS